ncbi:hypothetical protein [Corallococcus llansteffanensis]|uniref:hypothetical protein n=1 Tax=Corallococcus llansteffanensis TaxID=2316731 RepID=UPI0011C4706F|nr:hypothetical protein [Corallococcus llansteffanensis]
MDLKVRRLQNTEDYQKVFSVNWPDGPTGIHAVSALIRTGLTYKKCTEYFDQMGANTNLFCRSHYGDLQFFHAMANQPNESADVVRARILAWAQFLYGVATSEIAPDEDVCTLFGRETVAGARFEALAGLWGGDATVCKPNAHWTVYTLFNWKCSNLFSWNKCKMGVESDGSWTRARAVGALLHMIQDSFALGHTDRLVNDDATQAMCGRALVSCNVVREFHSYRGQDSKKHGMSDQWPAFDSSCFVPERAVDDPIVAGAWVLKSIELKRSWAEVKRDLGDRVFPIANAVARPSSVGECFK